MREDIVKRVLDEAEFLVENKSTIRATASVFGVSKSTVHIDICDRLFSIDKKLYSEVRDILEYNFSVRHIRGGESTRKKFRKIEVN